MLKRLFLALTLAAATGCTAPTTPASLTVAPVAQGKAPIVVPTAKLRHVLSGTAGIFGINRSASLTTWWGKSGSGETWNVSMPAVGRGTFTKASPNRMVYQVPDNQVLVINQAQGNGQILLNGYAVPTPQASISFIFGPGELVVFQFQPRQSSGNNYGNTSYFTYEPQAIGGYTTDPELLGKLGGSLVK